MANVNEIPVKSYLNLERDPVNDKHAATKGYVDGEISTLDAAKAAASHTHGAGDITSGTIGAARLPDATTSAKGAVIVGAGLSVSSGTISVDYATCKTGLGLGTAAYATVSTSGVGSSETNLVTGKQVYDYIVSLNLSTTYAAKSHTHTLGNIIYSGTTGYAAGTTISSASTDGQLATAKAVYDYIDGLALGTTYAAKTHSHAAGDITSGTLAAARLPNATTSAKGGVIVGAGLSVSSGTVSVDYATCKTGLGLGTAAYCATGTGSGNVPVLDGSGKLPIGIMPARVIGGEYLGEAANQAAMIAKSNATVGDFVKRTDKGTYWMLGVDADNAYATAANWFEYAGAVSSVNGVVGAVTQAQLGLVTTVNPVAAASDTSFPSEKAVASYVVASITALGLGSAATFDDAAEMSEDDNGLPTAAMVVGYVEDYVTDYAAQKSHTHTLGNIIYSGSTGYAAGTTISSTSTNGQLATAKAVYDYIVSLNLSTTYAAASHNHNASAINAGTLDKARLPDATTSAKGAVILSTSSTYSATDDTKAITGKAAKAIADASAAAATPKAKIFTITGDGTTTDFSCTHGLGVSNVLVQVYDSSGNQVWVAVSKTTTAVTFKFAAAPASGTTYTAVIFGVTAAS